MIRMEDKSRHTPWGLLAKVSAPRTIEQVNADKAKTSKGQSTRKDGK